MTPVTPSFSPMIFGALATEWNLRQTTLMSTLLAAQNERTASEKALAEFDMLNTTADAELNSIIGIVKSARHNGATGSVSLTALNTAGAAADTKGLEHRLAQARFEQAEEAVQAAEKALRAFERELAQQYPVVTTTPVAAAAPVTPPPPGPADPLALLKEAADLLEDGDNQSSNDKFDEFVAAGGVFPVGLKAKFEQAYAFGPRWGNKKRAYDAVLAWRSVNP